MVRKCTSRRTAEIAVMGVAHQVGVRTRARAALAMAAAAAASSVTPKRRKVSGPTASEGEFVKLSTTTTSCVELRNRKRVVIASENLVIPPSTTAVSNIGVRATTANEQQEYEEEERCVSPSSSDREFQASFCSSNGSASEIANDENDQERLIESVDLEDDDDNYESAEVETSTYNFCREIRREMTPSSKLREESDDVESSAKPTVLDSKCRSVAVAEKIMPSELEIEEFFKAAEKDIQKRFAEKYNYDIVKDTPLEGRYEWVRLKP